MIVAIYACEGTYSGLHGIYDRAVYDISDVNEANSIGRNMSEELIGTCDFIYDGLEEQVRELKEEDESIDEEAAMQELVNELVEYYIYLPNEELIKNIPLNKLDEEFCMNPDKFLTKYECTSI